MEEENDSLIILAEMVGWF